MNTELRSYTALPRLRTADAEGCKSELRFVVGTPLEAIEREAIVATLEHCRGRKPEAAALLGVSLKKLYNRLNAYRDKSPATQVANCAERNAKIISRITSGLKTIFSTGFRFIFCCSRRNCGYTVR